MIEQLKSPGSLVLPTEFFVSLRGFLSAGKYGTFTIHIKAGDIISWEVTDVRLLKPFVFRMFLQPRAQVLFRPEEIVDRSTTPLLDEHRVWFQRDNLGLFDLDADLVAAVAAGVFDD